MAWNKKIPTEELTNITSTSVEFAKEFGKYLGEDDQVTNKFGISSSAKNKLTTNQLRKFFGEVKRLQMQGFDKSSLLMLKPKLAYAVGRANKDSNPNKPQPKINDFYRVISDAIDKVQDEKEFKNFIQIFEAIVAYHKASESGAKID